MLPHPQLVGGRVEAHEGQAAQRRRRRRVALDDHQAPASPAAAGCRHNPVFCILLIFLTMSRRVMRSRARLCSEVTSARAAAATGASDLTLEKGPNIVSLIDVQARAKGMLQHAGQHTAIA